MRYTLAFMFTSLLCACGNLGGDNGISALDAPNGEWSAVTGLYPAVAKILDPVSRGLCTGTFISGKAVLTAAHCLKTQGGEFTVQSSFGTFRTRKVEALGPGIVGDPSDIALLLFPEPVAKYGEDHILPIGDAVSSLEKVRIIGFGCDDFEKRTGGGTKRTGTNQVFRVSSHIEILTPLDRGLASASKANLKKQDRGVIGPENRAGSCFGDSGGPMVREREGLLEVVGVSHAAGPDRDQNVSLYSDLSRSENQDFLVAMNNQYALGLFDASLFPREIDESSPIEDSSWLTWLLSKVATLFKTIGAWILSLF